jgi:hypothetical protein
VESEREEKERRKVVLSERVNQELSSVLEFSESLNTGPFNLFLSHIYGTSEWQGILSFK